MELVHLENIIVIFWSDNLSELINLDVLICGAC